MFCDGCDSMGASLVARDEPSLATSRCDGFGRSALPPRAVYAFDRFWRLVRSCRRGQHHQRLSLYGFRRGVTPGAVFWEDRSRPGDRGGGVE